MSQPPSGPPPGQQPYPGRPGGQQPYPGQPGGGQQPYPGQPYPGQPYPGQPYPGQGPPYPGQQYPGQGPGGQYPPPGQGYGSPGPYPGQGGPPQQYGAPPGQFGQGPASTGPAGARGAEPKEVRTSFLLWLAYLAVGLLGSIITFASLDSLIDAGLEQAGIDPSQVPPEAIAAGRAGVLVGVVLGLVLLALVVATVFQMRKGRNWARIVLAVLGGLSALGVLNAFTGAGTLIGLGGLGVVSVVLSAVQFVLLVAAIVFMFRRPANAWFAAGR